MRILKTEEPIKGEVIITVEEPVPTLWGQLMGRTVIRQVLKRGTNYYECPDMTPIKHDMDIHVAYKNLVDARLQEKLEDTLRNKYKDILNPPTVGKSYRTDGEVR